jgi:integrase
MTTNQTADVQTAVQNALAAATKAPRRERARVSTDEEIRQLRTELKGYKTFTTLVPALHVFTSPTGYKSFRFDYQTAQGVNKTHTLGGFGKLTLAMAVAGYEKARAQLMAGECPRAAQLIQRAATLTTVADEFAAWFPRYSTTVGDAYATRTRQLMESAEMKPMAARRLTSVERHEVLAFAQACEVTRSGSFAREAVRLLEKLFQNALLHGRCKGANPADGVVENLTQRDSQPWEALQLDQLPLFFADVDDANRAQKKKLQTLLALQLLPYMTVRPSVLRNSEWSWISWDGPNGAMLNVPAFVEGTKQRRTEQRADKRGKSYAAYHVPLSRQVVAILRKLQAETGAGRFLFPGYKGRGHTAERPISEGRWLNAMRKMGWDGTTAERGAITVHGFRSLFATAAYTRYVVTRVEEHALEFQQDHKLTDGVRAHYTRDKNGSHRGLLLPQRAALLQWWADEVDAVRAGTAAADDQTRAAIAAAFASRQFNAQSSGKTV